MSFLHIKDLKERDKTIKDFLATKERIKKRNLDERSNFIDYQRHLAQEYEPVVASTKEMTEKITNHLIPIKEDLGNLNALIARPKAVRRPKQIIGVKRRLSDEDEESDEVKDYIRTEEEAPSFGPRSIKFLNTIKDEESRKAKIDSIFGIRSDEDIWKIGNKRR